MLKIFWNVKKFHFDGYKFSHLRIFMHVNSKTKFLSKLNLFNFYFVQVREILTWEKVAQCCPGFKQDFNNICTRWCGGWCQNGGTCDMDTNQCKCPKDMVQGPEGDCVQTCPSGKLSQKYYQTRFFLLLIILIYKQFARFKHFVLL